MGIYLNPGNHIFQRALNSEIYVDKSNLIAYTNTVLNTEQCYVCVSRPRRFGKSMAAQMLAAYYGRDIDSQKQFASLKIAADPSYQKHLNQYNVIFLNMQQFLSRASDVPKMLQILTRYLLRDLTRAYPDIGYLDKEDLTSCLMDIYTVTDIPFIFIIDEWDCIFREEKGNDASQKLYLDFIRSLLKDQSYVALAYITGILPIKKYGTHSALNMFQEYSMTNPGPLASFVGFTEPEVKSLCRQYNMDFDEIRHWYDGYRFQDSLHIYNPRSVVNAMLMQSFDNFWNKTETFEALRDYIILNYRGLKDTIIELLSGIPKKINTDTFSNDMTTFSSADDVLTLLIHLGYLGYNFAEKMVFIPNSEIAAEFCNAMESAGWTTITEAIRKSEQLLQATLDMDSITVAEGIADAHMETSILSYNNENALACTIALAYYCAREYYMSFRELPTGKGFADIVYIPRQHYPGMPALVVELKWDKSAETALSQIKDRHYTKNLEGYLGKILLVGINYNPETKEHQCIIEAYEK